MNYNPETNDTPSNLHAFLSLIAQILARVAREEAEKQVQSTQEPPHEQAA